VDPGLYEKARAQLAEVGWCIIPDVIARDVAAMGVDRLWDAAEVNAAEGYSCFLPGIDPNPNMVRVLTPLSADQIFRDLIQHPDALEMVRAVVGPDIVVANCTANIARPGSRSMALHADLAFILPEPWIHPWSVNIVWCLTDAHRDNGATLYIPGSHHWRTAADVPADAAEQLVPFEAKAGSFIVMDGRLWHTSGANVTTDEDRALLFGYYSAAFLRPMINWTAAIPAELQASFSPQLRYLLGLDVFANTSNTEDQGHWKGMPVGAEQALADVRRARSMTVGEKH
jgi:hypothetical protein